MKRNALMGSIALVGLFALSACGGREAEETTTAEPAAEAEVEAPAEAEETAEAAAPAEPEVEANGTVIEVQMYTRDPDGGSGMQVFKPKLVTAQVGDTVTFVPTDPTHQSSSIDGMIPEGARGWEGEINQSVSYVLPTPGVYGYQCVPHYAAGMVGLIIVEGEGQDANVEAAKVITHPGLAGRVFEELFTEAGL